MSFSLRRAHQRSLVHAGPLSELWVGEMKHLEVLGRRILLLRTERGVSAYEDRCPHLGIPLSAGKMEGCRLTCAAHGWQFDADAGAGINPTSARLRRYAVVIEDGEVWIDLSSLDRPPSQEK